MAIGWIMAAVQALRTVALPFELLGLVQSLESSEVIVLSRTRYRVRLTDAAIAEYRHLLRPAKSVAILFLDDGTVRIREPP